MKTKYTFDFLIFDSLQNLGKRLEYQKTHLSVNERFDVSLARPFHDIVCAKLVSEMYENYKKAEIAKSIGLLP